MKEQIRERSFLNGKQTREWIGKRVVYRNKKDPRPFIRNWKGKVFLSQDPDGMLVLEHKIMTVKQISSSEFFQNIMQKLQP